LEFEMSGHLSRDQISKLLSGQATAEERSHSQVCDLCRQQVTQLAETLSTLRESVRQWASESKGPAVPMDFLRSRPGVPRLRQFSWIAAAAVLTMTVLVPLYWNVPVSPRKTSDAEDAILLEQINAQLSRDVPAPMESFMNMVVNPQDDKDGGRQ
jgi:hypothetical protein